MNALINLITPHLDSMAFAFSFIAGLSEGLPLIGVFVPGATIIIALAVYAKISGLAIVPIFICATLGAFLGDLIGYTLGVWKGDAILNKCGKWMFLTPEKRKKIEETLHEHPIKLIIVGRFNSLSRAIAPLLFGASKFNSAKFIASSALSSIIWAIVIVFGGYVFGKTIEVALHYLSVFFVVAILVTIILISMYRLIAKHHYVFRQYHVYTLAANIISLFIFAMTLDGLFNRDWFGFVDAWVHVHTMFIQNQFLTAFFTGITTLVDPINAIILVILFFVLLIEEKEWRFAFLFLCSAIGSVSIGLFLKVVTSVNRPDDSLLNIYTLSFPSNHTLFATVLAGSLAWIYARRLEGKHRRWLIIGLTILPILIGISRIYLRVHWVSDVVAAYALGVFIVTSTVLIMRIVPLFVERAGRLLKR